MQNVFIYCLLSNRCPSGLRSQLEKTITVHNVSAMAWSRNKYPQLLVSADRLMLYDSSKQLELQWQSELLVNITGYVEFNDNGDMFAALSKVFFFYNLNSKRT